MSGWVKLHRKILHSEMYRNLNSKQRDVLITLLLMANHKENKWEYKGEIYTVKPGQFVTSLDGIKANCAKDVSVQNIRTALLKLEKWGFLTNESTKTGRLITIVNWELYQSDEKNQQTDQQTANKELTPNKNDNNSFNNDDNKQPDDQEFWDELKDWTEQPMDQRPKSDYEKYFDQIEEYYNFKKGQNWPIDKPKDREAIKQLFNLKIPIDEVKKAIDHAFNVKGKRVNSFSYCAAIIFNRLEDEKEAAEKRNINNGGNKVIRIDKKKQPKPDKLPQAIRMQMEQQNQPQQPPTPEQQAEMEAKQAQIRAKLRLMDERFDRAKENTP